jgi:CheY-like chemotaxis protein
MPKSVTEYTLIISCPSDVNAYLQYIESAVVSFNNGFGNQNDIILRTLHWSKNAYSSVQKDSSAQKEINRQMVENSDMLVGVFWGRFGSPTESYGSGSEEEIEIMITLKKPVLLYFLDKPIAPSKIDPEQLSKVNQFKEKHKSDGLYFVLTDEMDLSLKLRDQLELKFMDLLNDSEKVSINNANYRRQKTLLWVDDRPGNNSYGIEYFEKNNIEVITALSTQQALKWIENNDVDVIVSDMGRKEGPYEGYVLLDRLRKSGNMTPFFIFAGSNSPEHTLETIRHGGQGNTNDFDELFDMVSATLLGKPQNISV